MTEADLLYEWEGLCAVSASIRSLDGQVGVAIRLSETLSSVWQSGDIIVFWDDGSATCLEGVEFEIVRPIFPPFIRRREMPDV